MAKQITDDEDRLKRQARRRLIGAVALTTAVVVVLPMVLDSEPKPIGQDIELRIPDKDKVVEFAPRIDTPAASAPLDTLPASQVVAVSAPAVVSPPVSQVAVAAAPAVAPAAAPVAAAPEIKSASSPAKTAAAASENKPEPAKHDTKADQARHEAKPGQAKHDAKAEHAKADHAKSAGTARTEQGQPAPQSGFIVQIGAFANPDTAHSWQKNLVSQGFKAYTEKLGNKTRVRIGPYATREAATKARHKLEAKGLHSNIVELN